MVENFPTVVNSRRKQTEETQQTPNNIQIHTYKCMHAHTHGPRHIIVQLVKIKYREKSLKNSLRKNTHYILGPITQMIANVSSEATETNTQ